MLKHVGKFHYLPPNINSEAYIKIALAAEMALRSSHNSYSTRATRRTCKMARFSSSPFPPPPPTLAVVRENFFSLLGGPPLPAALINSLIREPPCPRERNVIRSSSSPRMTDSGFYAFILSRCHKETNIRMNNAGALRSYRFAIMKMAVLTGFRRWWLKFRYNTRVGNLNLRRIFHLHPSSSRQY